MNDFEHMADALRLSTTAYGDIERGKTEIMLFRVSEIARVLEVSVSELLQTEGEAVSDIDWVREENSRLLRENAQLAFQNKIFSFCLKEPSLPERKRIGF